MASVVYIKSLFWLIGLGGLGYGLLQLTTPSQERINELKLKYPEYLSEDEKRKLLFMKKLKEASTDTPIYLKDKSKDSKN